MNYDRIFVAKTRLHGVANRPLGWTGKIKDKINHPNNVKNFFFLTNKRYSTFEKWFEEIYKIGQWDIFFLFPIYNDSAWKITSKVNSTVFGRHSYAMSWLTLPANTPKSRNLSLWNFTYSFENLLREIVIDKCRFQRQVSGRIETVAIILRRLRRSFVHRQKIWVEGRNR